MKRYLALLRGINVGKSKRISKANLAALFESLGFRNVSVYIQSGNVIFEAAGSASSVSKAITNQFNEQYSYDVPAMVLDILEFRKTIEGNKYSNKAKADASKVLIGFHSSYPKPSLIKELNSKSFAPNSIFSVKEATYVHCPEGVGRAKLPNFEKALGISITFRNARVCDELLKILNP